MAESCFHRDFLAPMASQNSLSASVQYQPHMSDQQHRLWMSTQNWLVTKVLARSCKATTGNRLMPSDVTVRNVTEVQDASTHVQTKE